MTFLRPEALWTLALLAPYAAAELLCILRGGALAGRLAPGSEAAAAKRSWIRRRSARALAGAAAWFFAAAALAGPSWGSRPEGGARSGVEAALVLDVSYSMLSRDVPPSRLDAAKDLARALVRARDDVPFSVVAFKGDAVLLCPLTDDPDSLDQALEWAAPSAITARGTAAGAGVRKALSGFSRDPGRARYIVLFSDGNDLAGGASQAAREARELGAGVLAVGCGGGAPAPAADESGASVTLPDGAPAMTSLRSDALRSWARESGGLYVDVSDPAALRVLSDALDPRPGSRGGRSARRPADRTGLLAFLSLLCVAARALLGLPAVPGGRKAAGKASVVLLAVLLLGGCADPRIQVLKGNRLAGKGLYEEAIAAYLKAGRDEGDGVVALNLATLYSRMEESSAAEPLYARAQTSGSPEVAAAAYHNQGVGFFEVSRFDEAAEAFIQALRLVPGDVETKRALELARAAASAYRASQASRRQASSASPGGKDEALLSLLRRAESDWFRPAASTSSDEGGPDH